MNKAAIYARYSSDKQTEDSIEAQTRACNEYAARCGLSVVGVYADEAISGKGSKTAQRKEYQRLLNDSDKGLFDTILIHKYDRVARSLAEHVKLEASLQTKGIQLVAVMQDFGSSNEAKIMRGLMWILSEYYSDNLAQEVKKGHKENALKAIHNGGKPPFGYEVVEGKYFINEFEAGFVRKIFEAAYNKVGFTEVIEEMETAGVRGRLGKPIKYTQIYDMLRNEKYIGTYIYLPEKVTKRTERREKAGAIRIEDALPAIIDKSIFFEVQHIMDNRLQTGKRKKANYLCSGLVYCECGAKMHAHISKKDNYEYVYYKCSKRCGAPTVKMNNIDLAAKHYLATLLSDDNQAKINAALRVYQSKEKNTTTIFKEAVKGKVAAKEREYNTLLSNMTKADLPPEVVSDLGTKLALIKEEIENLQAVEPPKDYTRDQITTWLETLKESPDEKAVQLLIKRIDITKEGFHMTSTLESLLSVENLELVDGLEPPAC